jgi:uncharacterized protein YecE (DUF72 family)
MKFGKVDDPDLIDFTLPPDHRDTKRVLNKTTPKDKVNLYVGCAKWNKTDLKGFYPKGTKDELPYYSSQFNSIELNASFYRIFPPEQFAIWKDKTPHDFKFFPKLVQNISHFKRLSEDAQPYVDQFIESAMQLDHKLGMSFLQLPHNFAPKSIDRLEPFFKKFPKELPLAVEFRHKGWFEDEHITKELYNILEAYNKTLIITDTAGRRDLMAMRQTTSSAFIRFNGTNHKSDYQRLEDWIERLELWISQGLQDIYFFVHQNIDKASPLLSAHFIKLANKRFGTMLHIPHLDNPKTEF